MSEIGKVTDKELDRLLGITPVEEPRTPNDTVCFLDIEIDKTRIFRPLSTDDELKLALRKGPAAKAEQEQYSADLYKASKSLERNFQIKEAEKALEKLVIFDQYSDCFEGKAAEHLLRLAINEERQGKLSEAEFHFLKGTEETKQERKQRLEEEAFPFGRRVKGLQPENDEPTLDNVPRNMVKAENLAALARIAKRRGFDQQSAMFLHSAFLKDDSSNGRFLQDAADPKNFEQLYYD